jgi:hypothetical protein
MALWCVARRDWTKLMLWRTGVDTFRVMQPGEPADLLTNVDYILFDRKYEQVLSSANAYVRLTPVLVVDKVSGERWQHYIEAVITGSVSAEEVVATSPAYPAIYLFGKDNVFVSEPLKNLLEQVAGQQLSFSKGLSMFVG